MHIQKTLLIILLACLGSRPALAQVAVESDPATGKKGLVATKNNRIILPLEYDEVKIEGRVVVVKKDRLKGLFTLNGKVILPVECQEVRTDFKKSSTPEYYGASKNFRWGLVDSTGKTVVPFEFADARLILPDLLAGIHGRSLDSIYFFAPTGKQVFAVRGDKVLRGFNRNTVQITGRKGELSFLDNKGKPVFPANISGGIWTDGKTIIAAHIGQGGIKSDYCLLSWAGDTLLAGYRSIRSVSRDRFVVESLFEQSGLTDEKGRFLIPLTPGAIRKICAEEGSVLELGLAGKTLPSIYDVNGKLLYQDCSAKLAYRYSSDFSEQIFHQDSTGHFILMRHTTLKKTGFCHCDGRQILPLEFDAIKYGPEQYPIIVSRDNFYEALDWSGRPALAGRFVSLDHTRNPGIMAAQHETNGPWAFVDLHAPQSAQFEFTYLHKLQSGFFVARKGDASYLHHPSSQRINPEGFAEIKPVLPEDDYCIAFGEKKAGPLVAIGRRKGQATNSTAWVGFDEQGKAWDFAQQPPKVMRKAEVGESPFGNEPQPKNTQGPADGVFTKVSQPPTFPGGESALTKFWADNLKYPAHANAIGITGYVTVSFVVEKDGTLSNIGIVRDIGGGCGKEAERLIGIMPKWIPGKNDGNTVRVGYSIQVPFRP